MMLNLKKIPNFSNIYSPENKNFTDRLPNRLASTNKKSLSPHKNLESTRQETKRLKTEVGIFNIPLMEQKRKQDKLKLGQQKIDQINYVLEVDGNSKRNYEIRMRKNELYFDYNVNPFVLKQTREKQKENNDQIEKVEEVKKKKQPLVQAMDLKRNVNILHQLKSKAQKIQLNSTIYLNKLMKEQNQMKHKKKLVVTQQNAGNIEKEIMQQIDENLFGDLDRILSIKQENYFVKKRNSEPFNLFELKSKPNSPMFMSGRQQLLKYFFSFDSMSANSQDASNQSVMRALSSYARISIIKSDSKSIPDDFKMTERNKTFDQNRSIENKLLIANGQLQPSVILKYLNEDNDLGKKEPWEIEEEKEKEQQKERKNQIVLLPNQQNGIMNWGGENLDKAELNYYQNQKLTTNEQKQIELSTRYMKDLKGIIEKQMECISRSIRDDSLLSGFEKKKIQILRNQLSANVSIGKDRGSVQRKIRMNKVNKNRAQKLKIGIVTDTFKHKRGLQRSMQEKIRSKR